MRKPVCHSTSSASYLKDGLPFVLEQADYGDHISFFAFDTTEPCDEYTVAVFKVTPKPKKP